MLENEPNTVRPEGLS